MYFNSWWASILPNIEYDIFICYRHNDNLNGWVTEFVKVVQEELTTTTKEPISIYVDSNPQVQCVCWKEQSNE